MEKYKNEDGKIAVLYSPGYGAGWYSWNTDCKQCVFDPEIVQIVLDNSEDDELSDEGIRLVKEKAEEKYKRFYSGGARDLCIEWLDEGDVFEIDEYDGYELIIGVCDKLYLTA